MGHRRHRLPPLTISPPGSTSSSPSIDVFVAGHRRHRLPPLTISPPGLTSSSLSLSSSPTLSTCSPADQAQSSPHHDHYVSNPKEIVNTSRRPPLNTATTSQDSSTIAPRTFNDIVWKLGDITAAHDDLVA